MSRLLIVDDETQLTRNIATYLESFPDGFEVATAATGEEAIEILVRQPIELMLTDVRLPGIDGIALVKRAFHLNPRLKVIIMTAFGSPEVRFAAARSGAFRFIEKPLDLEELRQIILLARPGEAGWTGLVGGLDIFDVAQLLAFSGKSRAIRVSCGRERGVLVFRTGTLVHASTGDLAGEHAFYRMTGWEGGAFEEIAAARPDEFPPNVTVPTSHLMMESARLRDEAGRGAAEAPAPAPAAGDVQSQSAAPLPALAAEEAEARKGKNMAIKDHLSELQPVEGFLGAAVFAPSGEMLDGVSSGKADIKVVGMYANNALLNAQKATEAMGVGRGNLMQIRAPQATVVMRCLNEATDFSATAAGKAHFHTVCLLTPEGNVAMATMLLDKIVGKIAEELR